MTNIEKYAKVFVDSFGVEASVLNETFTYQCVPAWDSVGHMGMIAALEDAFDIMMETDDIIDFSSYTKGLETLAKYGVQF
ncbi:acyl carrier protein [Pseudoduganella ginsengisoli]|jgi:acyl carrier protein|uniref:Acyl carrier protein n=1 Tax=Pseudoduganella ginsengisoli TaxID=1462440 RepID=A0A6L6PTU5_9BURK|nr:acyl carrier protein [Pseudoduganella ginsengisoli]MTW00504.1 acyl carrier protein [Pseudoduganella ginsengisoli]